MTLPLSTDGQRSAKVVATVKPPDRLTIAGATFLGRSGMGQVENDGIRVVYDVVGQGPALFLLHGATLDGSVWSRAGYVDDLKADHRLFIVDLRGHGRSDKPHDPKAYRAATMASDIVAIADAEGLDRFGIWGWSQGTIVAWAVARSAPDRVSAFIGTGDPDPRPWTVEEWAAFDRALLDPVRGHGMVGFLKAVEAGEPEPIDMKDVMLRADPDMVLALFAQELLTTDGFTPLDDFPVPALLIVGGFEDEEGSAERISATIRHGEFVRLPGVGHAGAFTRSDLALPAARALLDRWLR